MVSPCRSGCTTEHTVSHWLLSSAPSLSQYLWMSITCKLLTNDKLSILLPFHAFKSKVFQSSCIPKTGIHEVREQVLFGSSTTYFVPGVFVLPHRKTGTKPKDRGVPAEPGCSWRISTWRQHGLSSDSLLTAAEHYCSLSSHLFLGALDLSLLVGSRESKWPLPLEWSHDHR